MLSIESTDYSPTLRFKKGEYLALDALDQPVKELILPQLIIPPLSARDVEKNRQLSREEYFPVQIGRIAKHWGGRACLIDIRHVKFSPSAEEDAQSLYRFLSSATKFGCSAIPVVDMVMRDGRLASIRKHWLESNCGLALRISFVDLGREDLTRTVQRLLLQMVAKPSEVVLVLDLSGAHFDDEHEEFAQSLLGWLSRLQEIGNWRRIVVSWSSYPFKNPALPNNQIVVPRDEWKIWCELTRLDPQIQNVCMFGDFGADSSKIEFKGGGGIPITHLRYATSTAWLVVRGGVPASVAEGLVGIDGSIRGVAQRIIGSGEFAGETFSAGDEFIADCAEGRAVGSASEWRRANTNHHLTRVVVDMASIRSKNIVLPAFRRTPVQTALNL